MFVYFIAAHDFGQVKIGFSQDPEKRMRTLQTSVGCRLTLLGYVAGSIQDEHAWHARFDTKRVVGEWFEFDAELEAAIRATLHEESPASAKDLSSTALALYKRLRALDDEEYCLDLDIKDTFSELGKRGFSKSVIRGVLWHRRRLRAEGRESPPIAKLYEDVLKLSRLQSEGIARIQGSAA